MGDGRLRVYVPVGQTGSSLECYNASLAKQMRVGHTNHPHPTRLVNCLNTDCGRKARGAAPYSPPLCYAVRATLPPHPPPRPPSQIAWGRRLQRWLPQQLGMHAQLLPESDDTFRRRTRQGALPRTVKPEGRVKPDFLCHRFPLDGALRLRHSFDNRVHLVGEVLSVRPLTAMSSPSALADEPVGHARVARLRASPQTLSFRP